MARQFDWRAARLPLRCIFAVIFTLKILLRMCFIALAGILLRIPFVADFLQEIMRRYDLKGLETATMVVNWSTFVRNLKNFVNEAWYREAILDEEAPDVELMNLQTNEFQTLRSLQRRGRPLVVCFGSCT